MPADVVSSHLIAMQGQEIVHIMDDYGTDYYLTIPVTDSANRQTRINAALAQQSANQAALEAYAAAHGIDLSAQKAAGLAKKAKAEQDGD